MKQKKLWNWRKSEAKRLEAFLEETLAVIGPKNTAHSSFMLPLFSKWAFVQKRKSFWLVFSCFPSTPESKLFLRMFFFEAHKHFVRRQLALQRPQKRVFSQFYRSGSFGFPFSNFFHSYLQAKRQGRNETAFSAEKQKKERKCSCRKGGKVSAQGGWFHLLEGNKDLQGQIQDSGFWSGGPHRSVSPRGALRPKNRS